MEMLKLRFLWTIKVGLSRPWLWIGEYIWCFLCIASDFPLVFLALSCLLSPSYCLHDQFYRLQWSKWSHNWILKSLTPATNSRLRWRIMAQGMISCLYKKYRRGQGTGKYRVINSVRGNFDNGGVDTGVASQ